FDESSLLRGQAAAADSHRVVLYPQSTRVSSIVSSKYRTAFHFQPPKNWINGTYALISAPSFLFLPSVSAGPIFPISAAVFLRFADLKCVARHFDCKSEPSLDCIVNECHRDALVVPDDASLVWSGEVLLV
uniref:Uncharacterized protein n=1 Tax=Aegilops tauschii subsp. strangulata TaxID=200361 RepID=A0A453N0W6_AEGTS